MVWAWCMVQNLPTLSNPAYQEHPRLTIQQQKPVSDQHSHVGQAGLNLNGSVCVTSGDLASQLSSKTLAGLESKRAREGD